VEDTINLSAESDGGKVREESIGESAFGNVPQLSTLQF
jgi:hypothetical protein